MSIKTEDANLSGAEFTNTNLSAALFSDVNLSGAQFVDVNLAGARFEDMPLTGAILCNVNSSHVTIEDACYEGMRLDGILVIDLLHIYRSEHLEAA